MVMISPKFEEKQKYHRLFDVFIDLSSFLNGIPDRGEIVIRQNDVRRLFCHIGPFFPMAIPTSAALKDGASFTPSPVMATIPSAFLNA